MNRRIQFVLLLLVVAALKVSAQGTAFNYQGRLNDGGSPANASYDFRFAVYNAVTNGNQVSVPLTNSAVAVSNGLFNVTLDFGAGIFTGTNYWLDIAVRATGATNFTTLFPRQPVLPVPYAIFATSASNLLGTLSTAQLVGTLASAQIFGTYSGQVNFPNGANTFSGAFTGNGAALTNLNATQLTVGTVADARLTANVALLNQNQTFTGSNNFYGGNNFTNGANNFTGNFSGAFTGNGAGVTNLNASQLTSGTVADVRLSTNVALLNANQMFTGNNQFNGANTFNGANNFSNFGNSFSGSFFGNGLVGWVVTNGPTVQAVRDHGYMLTNARLATVILPLSSSLTNGDIVRVSGAGGGGWLVQPNSGQSFIGDFASYTNCDALRTPHVAVAGDNLYLGVAASADGTRIFYVGSGNNGVNYSADSAINSIWTTVTGVYFSGTVRSIACSANGRIVYAELGAGGFVQKSTDGGVTWAATTTSATGTFLSCSADGSKLFTTSVACSGDGTYLAKFSGSSITISTNGGTSFPISATAPGTLGCLAAASDCTRLLAGVTNGLLYASANQGKSWTVLTGTPQDWAGAWMSPDGSKFAAAAIYSGTLPSGVYAGSVSPLPNTFTTNSLVGSQGSAVELQYIGNGQFMPVSSTGIIWAN